MGHDNPPPSYDSIFKQFAQKKEESDGVVGYTQGAADVFKSKTSSVLGKCCCGVFCSLLGLALPVAEIVIGSLYIYDCPAQRMIPIYLIVNGVFSILSSSSGGGRQLSQRKSNEDDIEAGEEGQTGSQKAAGCCSGLISLFLIAWFICGNVWVFRMQECDPAMNLMNNTVTDCFTTQTEFSNSSFYCRKLLYDFTFYETIAKWAVLGSVFLLAFFLCCCMCCVYCCVASGKKEEKIPATQLSTITDK